jgi:hypothetical protein
MADPIAAKAALTEDVSLPVSAPSSIKQPIKRTWYRTTLFNAFVIGGVGCKFVFRIFILRLLR